MAECPICGGRLRRIHRRTIDRIKTLFVPLSRYSCKSQKCNWEGTMRDPIKPNVSRGWWIWIIMIVGALVIGDMISRCH